MQLIVSSIPEEGLEEEFDLPITVGDNTSPDIAHVSVKISRLGKRVIVDGSVNISLSFKCSRCLGDFPFPQDIIFSGEYKPAGKSVEEGKHELAGNELDISYYTDDEIDVREVINQQVLLTVPMKPLCDEECKGICPGCGKNLNEGSCTCKENEIDPRLAPLEQLRELMNDRKE